MKSSISRRLVIWLAIPLMLLSLCSALVHYINTVGPGVIGSDKRLRQATSALIEQTLDSPPGSLPSAAPSGVIYSTRDSHGGLLAGNPRLPIVQMGSGISESIAMIQVEHHTFRSMTTRFDTPAGVALLTVADLRPSAEPTARYGFMSTLLSDFVQLDITLVLVWVGIQLGLRPIRNLRAEIAARSPQDLRPIDESSVPRELASVVVTLNRLFGTLRSSAQSQQQFIANTAHQLRTPLTGLQAQLELLLAESAAAPVRGRLLTLQEGIRRLAHSSNQLLTLARAGPTVNPSARNQEVWMNTIVGEVVAKFYDRALQSNIDLGVETEPVSITADPALIDDLLSNLVDNALKHTPPGGSVTVSTGLKAGKAFLAVDDTGAGIPEADRQRVRRRFYRMPNSPGHGSGLGLAIVEEIAHLYGALVSIETAAGGHGTRVSVIFSKSHP